MNDLRDALSLPVVDDWPGNGTAMVGYGSIGGLMWDAHGNPVFARQNTQQRLVNQKTIRLAEPVQPQDIFKSYPNSDLKNTHTFLSSLGAAGIPEEFLTAETFDTANTTSPSTFDPQVGQRIYEVDPLSGTFAFADDNYVFLADRDDRVIRTIDLCSPVLQLDKFGLVRTRRGLATIDADGGVEYMQDGFFMHATSKGSLGEEVLATSTGGTIMLFDLETNTRTWKQTMSRGSMSRWSRVIGLENPATILWCNRYEMALVDLRMKPKRWQRAVTVLDYSDRLAEIREIDAGFQRGSDIFALTSKEILWVSATSSKSMHPVLSTKHMLSDEDVSLNFYRGSYAGNDLLTISSQIAPQTAVGTFGRTEESELPISTRDIYFVQAWPSIIPQSHITRETSRGIDLYTVGRDGGLFKQTWINREDCIDDGMTDLPPPDPLPEPNIAAVAHPDDPPIQCDYDLFNAYDALKSYHFHWLYRWAFKPLDDLQSEPQELLQEATWDHQRELKDLGPESQFWTSDGLRDHLERAWLDPLEEKSESSDVHPQALEVRRYVINRIVQEALRVRNSPSEDSYASLTESANALQVGPEYTEMLEKWQVHEDNPILDTQWEATSQPTQMPYSSQSSQTQPLGFAGSFSQPTLGLPSLKIPKKRRGDKKPNKKKKSRH